jgi:hypothetical protein
MAVVDVAELTTVRAKEFESDVNAALIDHDPKKLLAVQTDFVKVSLTALKFALEVFSRLELSDVILAYLFDR